jgi:hypothetical protein
MCYFVILKSSRSAQRVQPVAACFWNWEWCAALLWMRQSAVYACLHAGPIFATSNNAKRVAAHKESV